MTCQRGVNLALQMAHRECNYYRLLKLIPDWESCDLFTLDQQPKRGATIRLSLKIIQRSRYSLFIFLDQQAGKYSLPIPWLQNMHIQVYLDLRSAEVVRCNGKSLSIYHQCLQKWRKQLIEKINSDYFMADLLTFWINQALAPPEKLPDCVTRSMVPQ